MENIKNESLGQLHRSGLRFTLTNLTLQITRLQILSSFLRDLHGLIDADALGHARIGPRVGGHNVERRFTYVHRIVVRSTVVGGQAQLAGRPQPVERSVSSVERVVTALCLGNIQQVFLDRRGLHAGQRTGGSRRGRVLGLARIDERSCRHHNQNAEESKHTAHTPPPFCHPIISFAALVYL